jgi:hypothetical protein
MNPWCIIGTLYLIAAAVQPLHSGHRRGSQAAEEESVYLVHEFNHCLANCCGATSWARFRWR